MDLGSCCASCDAGLPCDASGCIDLENDPPELYTGGPGVEASWGCEEAPFVYADDLGPGGVTALRHAQAVTAEGGWPCPDLDWHQQMGAVELAGSELGAGPCADGSQPFSTTLQDCTARGLVLNLSTGCCEEPTFPPQPQPTPKPTVPLVTEEQCAAREKQAFDKGAAEEQSKVIKTAVVSAVVSAVVGIAIGKLLS